MSSTKNLALIYDFDGTLIDGEMMNQGLLADLGYADTASFWREANSFAHRRQVDRVCSYMHMLRVAAVKADVPLTRALLQDHGARLQLRAGLALANGWFDQIAQICGSYGLTVEHYVITSGLAEMVEACPIAHRFKAIFGSRYLYDDQDHCAIWPAITVNYTTKTQYLFRINKGVLDIRDDKKLNDHMPEELRPVPFTRMVFIGDGFTDIPCFHLVKQHGGYSIAVLKDQHEDAKRQMESLVGDGRVDSISLNDHFRPTGVLANSVRKLAERLGDESS